MGFCYFFLNNKDSSVVYPYQHPAGNLLTQLEKLCIHIRKHKKIGITDVITKIKIQLKVQHLTAWEKNCRDSVEQTRRRLAKDPILLSLDPFYGHLILNYQFWNPNPNPNLASVVSSSFPGRVNCKLSSSYWNGFFFLFFLNSLFSLYMCFELFVQ